MHARTDDDRSAEPQFANNPPFLGMRTWLLLVLGPSLPPSSPYVAAAPMQLYNSARRELIRPRRVVRQVHLLSPRSYGSQGRVRARPTRIQDEIDLRRGRWSGKPSPLPLCSGSAGRIFGALTMPINSWEAAARNYSLLLPLPPHPHPPEGGRGRRWVVEQRDAAKTFCSYNGSLSPKEALDALGGPSF